MVVPRRTPWELMPSTTVTVTGGVALVLVTLLQSRTACALDNGVGLTPAMGYNTWDDFRCGGINASNIEKVAVKMAELKLGSFGYQYLSVDDCWAIGRDKSTHAILPDPKAFPQGMKAVVDFVHAHGLKFGIYTDRGTATCVGRPGSEGFEDIDAKTYAAWGVDYLKEDSCSASSNHTVAFEQYGLMRDALNRTGRPIYFDLCGWSSWYAPVGKSLGNAWRIGYDVNSWGGMINNAISVNKPLAKYAGPGGWNDMDALIGSTEGTAVHVTPLESRTQMTLWSMMAAPLIIGSNILNLSSWDLATYTNREVIAVDQDLLGVQGEVIYEDCGSRGITTGASTPRGWPARRPSTDSESATPTCSQIWLKKLTDGYALAFVNYTYVNATANTVAERPPTTRSAGAHSGELELLPCNASDPLQQWNITTVGGVSTIASRGDPGCWEITGCNYASGATVDTRFGCKAFPPPHSTDKCASNMAWTLNSNGTIAAAFSPNLCFDFEGGGTLETCTGARGQTWKISGPPGAQHITADDGVGCVSNGFTPQPGGTLSFDIVSGLGWAGGATVRDLWNHTDLGIVQSVEVDVSRGNGTSFVYKLTKA